MSSAVDAVADILPYRPAKAREDATASIGMIVFLASWAMMFAALFFAYAFVRSRLATQGWPPPGLPQLPVAMPGLNTVVLLASSAALQYAVFAVRKVKTAQAAPAILVAIVLGTLFLVLQLSVWSSVHAKGLTIEGGGPYASVFYLLTAFHGAHVVVGLVGLAVVCRRAFKGEVIAARYTALRLWTMYWHFVGAIWALMFVAVFVL